MRLNEIQNITARLQVIADLLDEFDERADDAAYYRARGMVARLIREFEAEENEKQERKKQRREARENEWMDKVSLR